MSKFLRDLFTGRDNKTWDLGRVMWALGVLAYFSQTLYSIYKDMPIDHMNWATGFGAIMAAGGAMLLMKKGDEPAPDQTTVTTMTSPPEPSVITTTTEGEVV